MSQPSPCSVFKDNKDAMRGAILNWIISWFIARDAAPDYWPTFSDLRAAFGARKEPEDQHFSRALRWLRANKYIDYRRSGRNPGIVLLRWPYVPEQPGERNHSQTGESQ